MVRELRYAARILVRDPGLTAIAVLALTLGIGLTTTMFSILDGTLLRGLPFEEPHQIVFVSRSHRSAAGIRYVSTLRDLESWRERQSAFQGLAGWMRASIPVSGDGIDPELRPGAYVSPNIFDVLRAHTVIGRGFSDGDDQPGAAPVIVISDAVWKNRFGGDPGVVGRTVRADGEVRTIVGVMPEGFGFPGFEDVWLPMTYDAERAAMGGGPGFNVVGRLRDGVSVDAAQTEMTALASQLEREFPDTHEGVLVNVEPYLEVLVGADLTALALTMMGGVFGVMLIACFNVANLLLARAVVRSREIAIRTALGASRTRVIAQLLGEALVLALVGGLAGMGFAHIGIALFIRSMESRFSPVPFWVDIRLDSTAAMFVLGLTVLATVTAGTTPALQASGASVSTVLQDESRGTSSMRLGKFSRALVVLEIALSCGLLIPAGLLIKSSRSVAAMDLGFATDNVFVARTRLTESDYPSPESQVQLIEDLLARVSGKPAVVAATFTSALPGLGSGGSVIGIEGVAYQTARDHPQVRWAAVSRDFFETFEVDVLEGRGFAVWDDLGSDRVAIVNRSFVIRFFGEGEPLGRRFHFGSSTENLVWRTIIGVVPDMMMNRRTRGGRMLEEPEGVYVPIAQSPTRSPALAIRTTGAPLELTAMVRAELAAVDADLPLSDVNTMAGAIDDENWLYSVLGSLFGIFGVAALVLASIGLYGVIAFSVSRRTGEIGVRAALGADSGRLMRMILTEGARQMALGLALGLAMAVALARLLGAALFQVEPNDPATFVVALGILTVGGFAASIIPAIRAARVEPAEALRVE